jgi:rubrerythrin
MPVRHLPKDAADLGSNEDWVGNNVAFTCPVCTKVFIVSAYFHQDKNKSRSCPSCKKSTGYVTDSVLKGGTARIEWVWD